MIHQLSSGKMAIPVSLHFRSLSILLMGADSRFGGDTEFYLSNGIVFSSNIWCRGWVALQG